MHVFVGILAFEAICMYLKSTTTIITFLQGLGQQPVPVQNLTSELMNLFGHLVGLLGQGISPMQGLYRHLKSIILSIVGLVGY
jgi:hypothetical protein